ncbi:YhgE/Pip domain-containing protein [Lysinibacillus sp. NPDC093712]|uniref:YhgE/Pip domain-containing protein n=1 Tax=Lysinibacillus sp. NPDC093712 TaxID=3390579 RepID=UPI003D00BA68
MKSKNKFLILPFIVATIVTLIFLAAQIPSAKVNPKHLPVALVNEDGGVMANTIIKNLKENAPDAVEFIEYDSLKEMQEGMTDRNTYGGLVIPATFTEQITAIQTGDTPANLDIYINEGVNTSVATSMEATLKQVVATISTNASAQITVQMQQVADQMGEAVGAKLAQMNAQGSGEGQDLSSMISPVQPKKVALLANPITATVTKVNAVGKLGSVPAALFVPLWMASMIGAVMLYLAGTKRPFENRISMIKFQLVQSLIPIIYGFFAGYLVTWYSTWMLGYEFESFNTVALFASIAVIAFIYMILSVVSWLRLPVLAFFALFIFFGLPLIQLVPEMIPSFYGNYILPWLPIRFLVDGIKEILYFGEGVMNDYTLVLMWIAICGFVLLWVRNLTKKVVTPEE